MPKFLCSIYSLFWLHSYQLPFVDLGVVPSGLKATSKDGLFNIFVLPFFFHSEEFSFYYLVATQVITLNPNQKHMPCP